MLPSPAQHTRLLPPYHPKSQFKRQRTAHTPPSTTAPSHQSTHAPMVVETLVQEEQESSQKYFPYWMRPQVIADREDRQSQGITPQDYGKRWRATFRSITGDAPVCMPGDRTKAREYWVLVREAMQKGGWSPPEWGSLYRAEKTWRLRAHGLDARFEVLGTRPGRAVWEDRERIAQIKLALGMGKLSKGIGAGA